MDDLLLYSINGSYLEITAQGDWTIKNLSRSARQDLYERQKEVLSRIRKEKIQKIRLKYHSSAGSDPVWGSLLLSFFCSLADEAKKGKIECDAGALPLQMQELIAVSYASSAPRNAKQKSGGNPLTLLGSWASYKIRQIKAAMDFVGEVAIALVQFVSGKAAVSSKDVWQEIYNAGASSLPIISLVSILLGLILAFVSAIQLQVLGAEIYVSSLITVSMVRVMSPVLTGIVIAGRIGASYAATIGSMQVNEEVDALKTFGINPMEFLVLPRFIALALMMPFLTVYSDFMGILGGYAVIFFGWDISFNAFLDNVRSFTQIQHIIVGLLHSFIFGILIALSGCYQGIVSGRDAEAVGRATTLAVVHSIIGIIVSTSILTIILSKFNL